VAQNAAADLDGPAATTGLYPPGSTFKIVTAGAAIQRNMATPNTLLGCPGEIDIGYRTIPNYNKFDLGTVPMARAFANSCNTTFAELASRMPPSALTDAASEYGIGADYTIEGLTTVTGTVPATVNLAERTEDGFGQGKVLVTPFGMALAAATVAAGTTPTPHLIVGRPTTETGDHPPADPATLDGLRSMMRLVVTNGTAKDIDGTGEVAGRDRPVDAFDGEIDGVEQIAEDGREIADLIGEGVADHAGQLAEVHAGQCRTGCQPAEDRHSRQHRPARGKRADSDRRTLDNAEKPAHRPDGRRDRAGQRRHGEAEGVRCRTPRREVAADRDRQADEPLVVADKLGDGLRGPGDDVGNADKRRRDCLADSVAHVLQRPLHVLHLGGSLDERPAHGHDRPGNRRPNRRHAHAGGLQRHADIGDLRVNRRERGEELRRIGPDLDVNLPAADC
jgi:hypothetical protein